MAVAFSIWHGMRAIG